MLYIAKIVYIRGIIKWNKKVANKWQQFYKSSV